MTDKQRKTPKPPSAEAPGRPEHKLSREIVDWFGAHAPEMELAVARNESDQLSELLIVAEDGHSLQIVSAGKGALMVRFGDEAETEDYKRQILAIEQKQSG